MGNVLTVYTNSMYSRQLPGGLHYIWQRIHVFLYAQIVVTKATTMGATWTCFAPFLHKECVLASNVPRVNKICVALPSLTPCTLFARHSNLHGSEYSFYFEINCLQRELQLSQLQLSSLFLSFSPWSKSSIKRILKSQIANLPLRWC